ncbi:MAG: hypothetical protein EOS18_08880 [Mesorhizobium sp.]|nr:MAG: hypothetical protein EOS18_08880 [Mesorhizobium sp.]
MDETEAQTVRHLFERYLTLKSVWDLVDEGASEGLSTRLRQRKDGSVTVTMPFGRGNLYHLLSNQIYIGKIRHQDQVYDGEREPIVTAAMFQEAQALLASQAPRRRFQCLATSSADRFALSRSWREIAIGSCQQARCPLPLLCLEAIRRPTAKRVRGLAPSCAGCESAVEHRLNRNADRAYRRIPQRPRTRWRFD